MIEVINEWEVENRSTISSIIPENTHIARWPCHPAIASRGIFAESEQLHHMKKQQFLGSLFSLLGGAMWGISGTIGQFMFSQKGISALWLTSIRLFISGIILLIYYFIKNTGQALSPWKTRRDRIDLLIYGLAGVSFCQLLYFATIQFSSAGVATILQDLSPVMILVCTCILAKRKAHMNEVVSIVMALFGVFLIVTHGNIRQFAVTPLALITGVLSAVTVTLYNVYPRRLLSAFPIPLLQGWSFLMGGSLYMVLFRPWTYDVKFDHQILLGILGVIVVGNLLAFNFYMKGVTMIGPGKASLYGFAEPVTAAILSTVLLKSPFTLWDMIGFICVFLMLLLLSLGQMREHSDSV